MERWGSIIAYMIHPVYRAATAELYPMLEGGYVGSNCANFIYRRLQ